MGVTLDTCHLFAAGYDFRTEAGYRAMIDTLNSTIGSNRVLAFHLNDAKGELGSHLDRHENIGKGSIGREGFRWFLLDPTWKEIPGYLETPLGEDGYGQYARDLVTLRAIESGVAPTRRSRGPVRAGPVASTGLHPETISLEASDETSDPTRPAQHLNTPPFLGGRAHDF